MNVAGVGKKIAHKGSFPKSNSIGFNTLHDIIPKVLASSVCRQEKEIKGKKTRKEEVVFSHR